MTKNKLVNQGAVRRVYRQIILLGMLIHVLYVALFGGLGMSGMVYYNVGSTVFYIYDKIQSSFTWPSSSA